MHSSPSSPLAGSELRHLHPTLHHPTIPSSPSPSPSPSPSTHPLSLPTPPSWLERSPRPDRQLIITLKALKNLKLASSNSINPPSCSPYAVIQFDHTESITQEARRSSSSSSNSSTPHNNHINNTNLSSPSPSLSPSPSPSSSSLSSSPSSPSSSSSTLSSTSTTSSTPTSSNPTPTTTTSRPRLIRPFHRSATSINPPSSQSSSSRSIKSSSTSLSPSRVSRPDTFSELEDLIWNHVAIFDIFTTQSSLFISVYHHPHHDHLHQPEPERFLGSTILDLTHLLTDHPPPTQPDRPSTNPPSIPTLPSKEIHRNPLEIKSSNHRGLSLLLDDSIDLYDQSGAHKIGSILVKIEINHLPTNLLSSASSSLSHQHTPINNEDQLSINDFEIIKLIGEGSYGQVYRIRKKDTRRLYAMKTLEKKKIIIERAPKNNKDNHEMGEQKADQIEDQEADDLEEKNRIRLERVLTEKKILELISNTNSHSNHSDHSSSSSSSSFLVGLKFSFETNLSLNLIIDLKSGGELMSYIQRFGGRFNLSWVVFYTAEILSGLKFLHSNNIAYRDLKPENCLLDATGHVALCDFGLSKLNMDLNSTTKTFCGTTEYIAPEVLLEKGYTRLIDFWSLGVLIFEMSVGWTPFFSENRAVRYSLILESNIAAKFPKRGINEVTKDIILRLLEREPNRRLGAKGIEEIEGHEFFKDLDWVALRSKRLTPPFKPRVESDVVLSSYNDPNSTSYSSYGNSSTRRLSNHRHQQLSKVKNGLKNNSTHQHLHTRTQHPNNPVASSSGFGGVSGPNRSSRNPNNSGYPTTSSSYQYQQSRRSSVENQFMSSSSLASLDPNYDSTLLRHPPPRHHQKEEKMNGISGPNHSSTATTTSTLDSSNPFLSQPKNPDPFKNFNFDRCDD